MSLRRTLLSILMLILILALVACGAKPSAEGSAATAAQPAAASNPTPTATEQTQPTATEGAEATATTAATAAATTAATTATTPAAESGADDPEPNSIAQALAIAAGEVSGSLTQDDEDWFKVDVPKGSRITVTLTVAGGAGPMNVRWYDPDHYEIWSAYDVLGTAGNALLLGGVGGTHYLSVTGRPGGYTLQVDIESQNDGGSGGDAGDEITAPHSIKLGDVVEGVVGDYDESDWYRFEVPHGSVLSVSLAADREAPGINTRLFDPDQYEIWSEYDVRNGREVATTQVMSTDSGGAYYIQVHGTGAYIIRLDATQQDDAGSGDDAGDVINDALPIELRLDYEGLLGGEDYEDWYEVEVPAGAVVTVRFTPQSGGSALNITAHDPEEYVFWDAYDVRPGRTASGSYVLGENGGGTFYLRIHGAGGAYRFSIGAAAQDDAGSGGDAPHSIAEALEVETGKEYSGQVGDEDYEDWYTFAPAEGQIVRLTVESGSEHLHVALLDDDEYELWSEYDVRAGKSVEFEITEIESEPFFLRVYGAKGTYRFSIGAEAPDGEGSSGGASGATIDTALEIEAGVVYEGQLADQDDEHWYSFAPVEGQTVRFAVEAGSEPLSMTMTDDDGWSSTSTGMEAGTLADSRIWDMENEPIYIQIYGGEGSYTLELIEP